MRPDDLVDRSLVARSLAGDREAFGQIVRRHQQSVYGIVYRTTGDREVARELSQEAFLRAYAALERFDLERPLTPWLYRIAANLGLRWAERRRLETVSLAGKREARSAFKGTSSTPEEVVLAAERQARLRSAIEALPAARREVILLRHGEDLSYQEISQRLGIPLSSVKSRLFRARRQLRDLLSEEGER